ncbi:helix-turn-helix transcriptional regulator [Streptomyces liangshanensis]|uniref:helix-turn-helix transcriptional regulator n=1 Tax=Streptomyces liangshanensis TaxID=2717324 RepID=UPI0036D8BAE5
MGRYGGTERTVRIRDSVVRAAGAARNVEDFFDAVTRAMAPALRFDVWAGVTVDPDTLINTGGNYRNAVPDTLMPRMLDIEYREGDVNSLPELAQRPVPVGLLSEAVGGDLHRSPRYRDIAGPLGYRDELRVLLRDRHGAWGALVLGVGDDGEGFGPAATSFAAALAQPLGDALRRLHLTRRAQEEPAGTAPGLILLDDAYRPVHLTPAVARWFDDLPEGPAPAPPLGAVRGPATGGGPGGRPPGLPPAVYAVAAAVRAPGAPETLTSWAVTRGRGRGRVRLHAWQVDGPAPARVAVVVEQAAPGEHIALIVAAYGLTPRERDIATLVLRGLPTAEIARYARLSPHTVQDHLKSVFDKTGVRSRRDLVGALFARHFGPRRP